MLLRETPQTQNKTKTNLQIHSDAFPSLLDKEDRQQQLDRTEAALPVMGVI
jgi:hypothetical protein